MTRITVHKMILALLLCAGSVGAAEFKVANVLQDPAHCAYVKVVSRFIKYEHLRIVK